MPRRFRSQSKEEVRDQSESRAAKRCLVCGEGERERERERPRLLELKVRVWQFHGAVRKRCGG